MKKTSKEVPASSKKEETAPIVKKTVKNSDTPASSNANESDQVWNPVLGKFVPAPEIPAAPASSHVSEHALTMLHQLGSSFGIEGFDADKMGTSTDFTVSNKGFAVIQAAYKAIIHHQGMPDSWRPYAEGILLALKIAKVFTPPHIDVLIDKIILAIEIALGDEKKSKRKPE